MRLLTGLTMLLFLLMGCGTAQPEPIIEPTPTITTSLEAAEEAVLAYLGALADGDYMTAAEFYGGSYEVLVGYNPDIDPADQAALLERACTVNGFQCLPVRRVVETAVSNPDQFQVIVEFSLPDGTLLEQGPCCGASAEDSPPLSQFAFSVVPDAAGGLRVHELPVYLP